jgi:hypothetical protein
VLYARRYVYTAATKTFALAEQYYISHSFNCKTPWATKVWSGVKLSRTRLSPHKYADCDCQHTTAHIRRIALRISRPCHIQPTLSWT